MAYRKPVMRTRGRAFEYAPVEKDEIKRNLRETLQTWTNNIEKAIDEW
jgi:predicted transcriptional regulator